MLIFCTVKEVVVRIWSKGYHEIIALHILRVEFPTVLFSQNRNSIGSDSLHTTQTHQFSIMLHGSHPLPSPSRRGPIVEDTTQQ